MSGSNILSKVELIDDQLSGFVSDPADPLRPRRVRIDVDGRQVATLLAGDFIDWRLMGGDFEKTSKDVMDKIVRRRVLPAAFHYRIPDHIRRDITHKVVVTAVLGNDVEQEIFQQNANLAAVATARLRAFFTDYRMLDLVAVSEVGADIVIQGWFSTPEDDASHVGFTCNSRPFGKIEVRPSNAFDRNFYFAFWPDRPFFEFEASMPLAELVDASRGYVIEGIDTRTGAPLFPGFETILTRDWQERIKKPLPHASQVGRNWRMQPSDQPDFMNLPNSQATTFNFTGSSHLAMLDRALHRSIGRTVADAQRVLDWGCGVGRLTQHLAELPGREVHGADIDRENVAWASANIPNAKFAVISRDPPTAYPEGYFDLVIAISVFTHLSETAQFAWLEELRRIVKPGGAIAVTVAGWHSFRRGRLKNILMFLRDLDRSGFSDSNIGNLLADVVGPDSIYYRNTKHMPEYVRQRWAPYFDVKAIETGALGGLQDIVVAVRPA